MSVQTDECREANEQIPEILEGTAPASVFEHIASCDACRDLRFEVDRAIATVSAAGADFRAPDDFGDLLVAAVLAARPEGPERATSGVTAASAARGSTAGIAAELERNARPDGASPREAGPREALRDPIAEAMGTARTELVAGAADLEVDANRTATSNDTVFESIPASLREERAAAARSTAAAGEPFVAVHKTVPLQAVTPAPQESSGRASGVLGSGMLATGDRVAQAVTGKGASTTDPGASSSPGSEESEARDAHEARRRPAARTDRSAGAGQGAPTGTRGAQVLPFHQRPGARAGMAAGLVAAVAAGWMLFASRPDESRTALVEGPWSGKVAKIARASSDGASGLEICRAGACAAASVEATFEPGASLRTDAKTRVRVELADGTVVALDRSSELELPAGASRAARLSRGVVTADVARVEGALPATFAVPQGTIEIVGTKIVITASERRSSVEVARGEVKVTSTAGKAADVRAGEEATIATSGEITVANASSLADSLEWSSDTPEEADAPALRGLGELRAKKPGETKERDGAVRLAKHSVKTRIVDTVARTEIEEVFTNQTDEELEGIFRFPLPPGAQIERLALEVNGELLDGAFVDRDRGAAIWRGVIQNAAPRTPRTREEIIWVPGPWRDPALLEWQRGGRFELRIFPIPKKGSRRIVLAYTQTIPQSGGVRRFSYPLAHDPSGSTRIDDFSIDLQVLGHDREFGVTTRGYDLKDGGGQDAARFSMQEASFVPAGDLTVEYALPNRTSEITTWGYRMDAPIAGLDPATGKPTTSLAKTGAAPRPGLSAEDQRAEDAARIISDDRSPFVAIALRPKLPRWGEGKDRVHAIVVDASRSMVGERFGRATRLASSIVREMDRRDAFVLLACDVTCQAMGAEPGRPMGAGPVEPSASAADDVERFLGGIEPDGGSDLGAAVEAARSAVGSLGGKEMRVIYLGDGTPSVGPTRPAHLEATVRHALPAADGSVVAVALGADADTTSLAALARGGGGVVVPYVPGQRVASAALDVLSAAYGVVLRDPVVELPVGLTQVTPARLDPILGGDEAYVFARMTGERIEGSVRLRGRVGDEPFEQTYPATIVASTSAGNAFVPRLFAAAKIDELERLGGAEVKPTIVALSRKFAVASRHTSLLVLESEAMFTAFGLDRSSVAPSFTGEVLADSNSADVDGEEQEVAADSLDALSEAKGTGGARAPAKSASRPLDLGYGGDDGAPAAESASRGPGAGGRAEGGFAQPAPTSAPAPQAAAPPPSQEWDPFADRRDEKKKEDARRRPPPRPSWNDGRPLVPMRRVFDRKASFTAGNILASEKSAEVVAAEAASKAAPDSRDRTTNLFALYSATGRVGEAQELAARWSSRDALDPDALIARADLAARNGDRDRSARIMSGLADVRPGDRAVQERLAEFHETAGEHRLACRHRLSLADLAPGDAKVVADASRCAREQGLSELAGALRADAPEALRATIDRLLLAPAPATRPLLGDVRVAATWTGGEDLDISLVDGSGKRISWSGSPSKIVRVSAQDAASAARETLAVANLGSGQYVVEIARARDGSSAPVSGEVAFTLPGGVVQKVPFTMTGPRAEVGTVRVFFTSRLVPVDQGRSW